MNRIMFWCFYINNATDSCLRKHYFYTMKNFFLEKFGTKEGFDYQHIEKQCWHCNGEGDCWSCDGSGIYSEYYVQLERWILNDGVFHRPSGVRLDCEEMYRRGFYKNRKIIDGYIEHKEYSILLVVPACFLLLLYYARLLGKNRKQIWIGVKNFRRFFYLNYEPLDDVRKQLRRILRETRTQRERDFSTGKVYHDLPF